MPDRSNFLSTLVQRERGQAVHSISPRLPSRYESTERRSPRGAFNETGIDVANGEFRHESYSPAVDRPQDMRDETAKLDHVKDIANRETVIERSEYKQSASPETKWMLNQPERKTDFGRNAQAGPVHSENNLLPELPKTLHTTTTKAHVDDLEVQWTTEQETVPSKAGPSQSLSPASAIIKETHPSPNSHKSPLDPPVPSRLKNRLVQQGDGSVKGTQADPAQTHSTKPGVGAMERKGQTAKVNGHSQQSALVIHHRLTGYQSTARSPKEEPNGHQEIVTTQLDEVKRDQASEPDWIELSPKTNQPPAAIEANSSLRGKQKENRRQEKWPEYPARKVTVKKSNDSLPGLPSRMPQKTSPRIEFDPPSQLEPASQPTINVTIGRIEVRAITPPAPTKPNNAGPKSMSLEEYLNQHSNGSGRRGSQ